MNRLKHIALKGAGYFCDVKKCLDEETEVHYALKELKKKHIKNEDYIYRFNREILLLKELQDCENIIELISYSTSKLKDEHWYVMPFAQSNLYDYIKKNNASLSKEEKFKLVRQIIKAIEFAHSKDILHRDISPNNVLIFEIKGKVVAKVCDFGLGKDKNSLSHYTKSSASGYGQILYVSPEQREQLKDATARSDIYSLGKLVYFIFTGKDPDNLKPFELSSLVSKATEENPEHRFKNIIEFKRHFKSLKELQLNQKIPSEYITLKDIVKSGERFDWFQFHRIAVEGKYLDHVYYDFLEPVLEILSKKEDLINYYQIVGTSMRDSVRKISENLYTCYSTYGWPFSETKKFGKVLKSVVSTIQDSQIRLTCLEQLWHLAYVMDQWAVQSDVKEIFNSKFITKDIETQLSEFIIKSEVKVEISDINGIRDLPNIIKSAMIKGDKAAKDKEEQRRKDTEDW